MQGTELIEKLGTKLGQQIELDENYSCNFQTEHAVVTISLLPETEELCISADLGPLPEENQEQLLLELLKSNYQFKATLGNTLGINPKTQHGSLYQLLSTQILDEENFSSILQSFATAAEHYAQKLSDYAGA
ncbi:MAG: type III secretion system chaperone [Succinivibrio sp.]|nr:type III secretion system chaperone [Succinivibrio sp.]